MNFNRLARNRKTMLSDFQLINAVRQALHIQPSELARRQSVSILVGLADDLNRCSDAEAGRIGHFEAQFAAGALAIERQRAKDENSDPSLHEERAFVSVACVRGRATRRFPEGVTFGRMTATGSVPRLAYSVSGGFV